MLVVTQIPDLITCFFAMYLLGLSANQFELKPDERYQNISLEIPKERVSEKFTHLLVGPELTSMVTRTLPEVTFELAQQDQHYLKTLEGDPAQMPPQALRWLVDYPTVTQTVIESVLDPGCVRPAFLSSSKRSLTRPSPVQMLRVLQWMNLSLWHQRARKHPNQFVDQALPLMRAMHHKLEGCHHNLVLHLVIFNASIQLDALSLPMLLDARLSDERRAELLNFFKDLISDATDERVVRALQNTMKVEHQMVMEMLDQHVAFTPQIGLTSIHEYFMPIKLIYDRELSRRWLRALSRASMWKMGRAPHEPTPRLAVDELIELSQSEMRIFTYNPVGLSIIKVATLGLEGTHASYHQRRCRLRRQLAHVFHHLGLVEVTVPNPLTGERIDVKSEGDCQE